MKIDGDLRAVIRSAERVQKSNSSHDETRARHKKAIADLVESKRLKPQIALALRRAEQAKKCNEEANQIFDKLGINCALDYIRDDEAFAKAGGKYPFSPKKWSADVVIAELAEATPKQAPGILARYGIKWV